MEIGRTNKSLTTIRRFALPVLLLLVMGLTGCLKAELPRYGVDRNAVYTVRSGDSLYTIGKRYGVDHNRLARRNRIKAPYTIYVGQQLSIWSTAPKSAYIPIPKARKKPVRSKRKITRSTRTAKAKKTAAKKKTSSAVGSQSFVRLRWPVKGKVTTRFGRSGQRMNDGIDIAAAEGTPVYAAAAGEIVYSDRRLPGYGKLIIIRHKRNQFTAYAHNQRNLVKKGDQVVAGDLVARVGKTGRTSGPHLHFEVRRGSTPVDPLAYLPKR